MKEQLATIASEYGTPCYVYFMDKIDARIESLNKHFGGRFVLSYAVKSNPNTELLTRLRDRIDFLDISSAGELRRAQAIDWPAERISFTGPGKKKSELAAAVNSRIGEVIVESVAEARDLDELARAASIRQTILVRIAPQKLPRGFGVNMAGKPSQFGIDEEDLDDALGKILSLKNLNVGGFHIYSGTQCLNAGSIAENYENFVGIFRHFSDRYDLHPGKLVFGSGLGIPYHEGNEPLDLEQIADRINPLLDSLKQEPRFHNTTLVLELGRYLVGEAGIYLTRVINKKHSRGVDICICDGGMHHHLGACGHLGSVIHRNYRMFKVDSDHHDAEISKFELVGPLCTTIDTLGHGVSFPGLEINDIIGIHCSGAYGLSASPIYFISHDLPGEFLVDSRSGSVEVTDISHGLRLPG